MVETDPAWVQQALFLRSKLMRTTETFIYDVLQHARVPPQIPAKGSRLYPAPALCLRAVPDPAGGCSLGFLFFGVLSLRNVLRLRPDDRGSNVLAYRMSSKPAFANNRHASLLTVERTWRNHAQTAPRLAASLPSGHKAPAG
jgi:hypothetical protein